MVAMECKVHTLTLETMFPGLALNLSGSLAEANDRQ